MSTGQFSRYAVGLALVTLWLNLSAMGDSLEYPCYPLPGDPFLDGSAEEDVWKNIPEATGFHILGAETNFALVKQSAFKAGWTKDNLYLFIHCDEPTPDKMWDKGKDNGNLWEDDGVELFFIPKGREDYYQLIANSAGSRWNGQITGQMQLWDWQTKCIKTTNSWSLEVKIPFSIFSNTPVNGATWLFNIARNMTSEPKIERYTCWSPLKDGFADVGRFRTLVFKDSAGAEQDAKNQEGTLNARYKQFLQEKLAQVAKDSGQFRTTYKEQINQLMADSEFQKDAGTIKELLDRIDALSVESKPDFNKIAQTITEYSGLNLDEKVEDLYYHMLLAKLCRD